MKILVLGNGNEYELISSNIVTEQTQSFVPEDIDHDDEDVDLDFSDENVEPVESDPVVIECSFVIAIIDGINRDDIIDEITEYGLSMVKDGNSEFEFSQSLSFVLPDISENIGGFYLGLDNDGNKRYAQGSLVIRVLPSEKETEYLEPCIENTVSKMSAICHGMIERGMEIQLSDGKKYVFSYNSNDRENIKEMFDAVLYGATSYPYHENDGNCQSFSAVDIVTIYSSMVQNKTHHTTYFNQLKQYIKSLKSVRAVSNVQYGQPLDGIYLDNYNSNMAEAGKQMENILSKLGG